MRASGRPHKAGVTRWVSTYKTTIGKTRGRVVQGLKDEIAAQKDRLFLWFPVFFGAGIGLYFGLKFEPSLYVGAVPAAAFFPLVLFLYRRHFENAWWFLAYVAAFALFLASLGFTAAKTDSIRHGTPLLQKPIGPVKLEGFVEHVEKQEGKKGSRAVLSQLEIESIPPESTPRQVRLTFRKDEGLAAGQRVSALVKLNPPSGPVAPGAYDFRRHLYFEGIGAVGFSYTKAEIKAAIDEDPKLSLFFENMRTEIEKSIRENAGEVAAGIMGALITGERGAIAEEDNDAMRDSGLYHLLSISGAHVCMVAGVLFFFSRLLMACWPWFALRYPIKKIAAGIAILGAAFYVFLAGAEVPALRSLMMTALVMLAIMLDRSPFSLRLIAFSALVLLALSPHALVGVSFQMSFAAVAALIAFFDYTRPWWTKWQSRAGWIRKSTLYLLGVLVTTLIGGGMTGLFSLYHFQSFSLYGVLANMIAVPLTATVIMPAAIVAMILMPFGLEQWALQVMEWGTLWMLSVAHWTAGLEGAVFHVRQWPEISFALIAFGTVLFLLWEGWRGKILAAMLLTGAFVAAALAPMPDILVSESGKLAAARVGDEYYFSSRKADKFTAENWMRLAGEPEKKPESFYAEGSPVLCDSYACRVEVKGKKISILRHMAAVREDCGWADVVISQIPLKKCGAAATIDLYDAKYKGAHAVYIGRSVDVQSVAKEEGRRPWSLSGKKISNTPLFQTSAGSEANEQP
jgi:competence protein ComEC